MPQELQVSYCVLPTFNKKVINKICCKVNFIPLFLHFECFMHVVYINRMDILLGVNWYYIVIAFCSAINSIGFRYLSMMVHWQNNNNNNNTTNIILYCIRKQTDFILLGNVRCTEQRMRKLCS